MARQSARTNRKPASDIALAGEKVVKATSKTVPVERVKQTAEAKRPRPAKAVDQRRNVAFSGPAGMRRSEANPTGDLINPPPRRGNRRK